jgi:hypothetical protein
VSLSRREGTPGARPFHGLFRPGEAAPTRQIAQPDAQIVASTI